MKFKTNSSKPNSAPSDNEIEKSMGCILFYAELNWLKFVHFLCEFELCLVNNQWNVSYSKEFSLKILAQLGLFCITCPFKREKDLCLKLEINSSLYSNFL